MNDNIRLQKFLSDRGVASRRKAEELIISGKVKVNGIIADKLGVKVGDDDIVEYDGKILQRVEKVYIVLNKPTNYICSRDAQFNRKSVYDIIGEDKKIFTVGRLDYMSEGLIILTNDGDFANNILHPSKGVKKEYIVESDKKPPANMIKSFINGVKIGDITYKASNIVKTGDSNVLRITLGEGKKREIREVYKFFGLEIKRLLRDKIGKMSLDALKLPTGEFKYMSKVELERYLYGNI
ncbi:MAG: rRNA pseudouridine synthase [Spirochaetes bacterium]|nr:rRNA pseudouridine synthase [Spirochaetota bacterium]